MNLLKRIPEDLKRGENIDLYATVGAALILAILNVLGMSSERLLNSLELAVPALLASAILGNRHRLSDIQERLGSSGENAIVNAFPEELNRDLERASEIWILGAKVNSALRRHRILLENKISQGSTIRILIVDPHSPACEMAAARVPGKISVERERAIILANLNDLCEMKKVDPSKLQIRIINDPLMYGGYMLDPNTSSGVIYIRRYSYQRGERPRFVYRQRNGEWFEFIKAEFITLWDRGAEWDDTKAI